ncbi:MAG: hypothetical protein JSR86_22545, partial [Proteobacteria bacterium]|nr:hypothetical protein [Pseudomonadota bacterium]
MGVGPITPPSGGTGVQPVGPGAVSAPAPGAGEQPYASAATTSPAANTATGMAPAEAALALLGSDALATQDGLAPLLADLGAALEPTAAPDLLSPAARDLAARILAAHPPLGDDVSAEGLKAAVQSSGLFLEAALAAALTTPGAASPGLDQDLKALLTRFVAELDPAIQA